MEAAKQGQPLEFVYNDLTVLVKPHATSQDRMDIAFTPGGKAGISERFKLAARLMVVGWRGLTRDGEKVPYSVEELENVADLPERSFAIELGNFIWQNTDISGRKDEELKNASRQPSSGKQEPALSTAAGKTAQV